jgi:hypothetical protein
MLKTDIEKYIISESTLSPIDIENQTSSLADHYIATINLPHFTTC